MFILILTYQKGIDEVEKYLENHKQYLDKYYQAGKFIASGRQNPRVGGVILCHASNRAEAEGIITHDPFYINHIADYRIIEFEPTKYTEDFKKCCL